MKSRVMRGLAWAFVALLAWPVVAAAAQSGRGRVEGTVVDGAGAPVAGARVSLRTAQQAALGAAESDAAGRFAFDAIAEGTYEVVVARPGFAERRASVDVREGERAEVTLTLAVAPIDEEVTVTAETGQVNEKDRVAQAVTVISSERIRTRVGSVLAEVADEEAGLALQRTSPTIGAIFVRGLTGKNVAVYVDGVRYTTSAQRGGISTFFNLNEPTGLGAVEVLRGPNSAQFGSDSLGGTVSLVSRVPYFSSATPEVEGELTTSYDSPANAFGANLLVSYGSQRFGVLANVAARRASTIRPADGLDGHAAVTRFLGLPSDVLGESRLPDTAFTQYGGSVHLNYAPTDDDQLVVHYQRGQQDGGKRYDQLLGGDGNLRADLRNLMLDFGYARYHRLGLGPFDSGTFTFSYNAQREERVNQGGQGNPLASITSQYEKTSVFGFALQLARRLPGRNDVLLGADVYRERVDAPAHTFSPATGVVAPSRPRIPDRARYVAYGFFAQDAWEAVPGRVWLSGALRYNVASYRSRAADAPVVNGRPLFPSDSLRADDFSGRAGVVVSPADGLYFAFNYSRGYRAPDVTDLGTLGLTGDGFEVAAPDVAGLGATVGTTADDKAVSSGEPVRQLRSETTDNFDLSVRLETPRVEFEVTGFRIDFDDTIAKQALVLPQGAVGTSLGGEPITAQLPNGVVFVGLSAAPVLVRANFGPARISGFESEVGVELSREWSLAGNFTYLRAEDRRTGAPPNIEGGTPPATANLRLRYEPGGGRYWVEAYATLADRQNRLSSLDLSDRRTGARRSRSSVAAFFANGARARGLVGPGADAASGTADDVLLATGETLAEVQARVLGSADSAPLFRAIPGYGIVGLRGGFRIDERSDVFVDFENIGDKSFRGLSWGLDGPGRGVAVSYRYRF
jgi:outer membrane receptor protein involved in Fe transport